ncbi:delta-60 repeat domain-containing protein [Deinococcus humi]|uniref:Putative delta-60 repeat protein n=1 Tax=Deinococcus humi TaxID=662880 RepID=A0A7W8JTB5_9DEIO|nr:Ig-like domain-containing protein [Deinococcus humi]MBB5362862.1 putative delta-60 repeat protein [Deinococcus humi]GGO25918.1 hypothetical protein GCM10008949_16190 [Deinococcus humi]
MKKLPCLNALLLTAALSACTTGGPAPTAVVKTIELSAASASLTVGQDTTLTAIARDAQGESVPNTDFAWKSSNVTVASVAGGVVKGLAAGSTQIIASANDVTSSAAEVTVNQTQSAGTFDLTLSDDKLPVITGKSASLTVNVVRKSGFTGAVNVGLSGLPAGVSGGSVTIPEGHDSATVTVSAAANAAHSLPTAVLLSGAAVGSAAVSRTVTVTVRGTAGSLDTTFGTGGIARHPLGEAADYGYAAALQPDGKLIVVGSTYGPHFENFGIARFTHDGALDPSFGSGGKVIVDFAQGRDIARAVAVQPDGKIVVAGGTTESGEEERFGLLRLNANGTLDAGFGTAGKLTTAFTGSDNARANAVLIQPDGHIVVGGQASFSSATSGVDFALARYLPSGALDTGFGDGGRVTTSISPSGGSDKIAALALQGDRIVAAGGDTFQLARYTVGGALDSTFGTAGRVHKVFPGNNSGATSVVVDDQNRLVVGGHDQMNTAVVRLTADGAPDPTFGSAGRTVLKLNPSNWNVATAVALQTDGKVVVGSWVYEGNSSNDNFAVTRLTRSGQVDPEFGVGGTSITRGATGKRSTARAALLQPDDRIPATRIVLAGDSNSAFTLTRYWP